MKIAYVSNIKNLASDGKPFNSEWHVGETLRKLGHHIEYIQEDEILFGSLPARVNGSDLFLWTRTWPNKVLEADLKAIEAMGIPTVSFHLDLYSNIARNGGIGEDAFWKTQYVFSPEGSPEAKEIFKLHGINQFYLPAGVFEPECYIADPAPEFQHEVVFVGGGKQYAHREWGYRGELVTFLENNYKGRFVKYGWPERSIRGEELNKLYSSSKIVIGDSLNKDFVDSYYYSDRAFETTGRGGFLIHPYIPGITDHFVDRKEIVLYSYGNWAQLENLINYYLEHDEEREAIRRAGHERTKSSSTYTHRMQTMLNVLKEQGAI